ncbi:NAD(P)H-hydrate dehydratase [Zymobacter sp. IVIA_5232.4 C2]|uniref:NAD(P)H-hydrate dehydratase n=1 Tax=Zymobacter sp. IVIA_5232.4 C2 TaxID=3394855 RepID=UPI0039C48A44
MSTPANSQRPTVPTASLSLEEQPLSRRLYTAEQGRALDAIACRMEGAFGLMHRAGSRAFDVVRQRWAHARRLVIVCGGGNNAGDGYVVAAFARRAGLSAQVWALVPPAELKGEAAEAVALARAEGVTFEATAASLAEADLIVDALLGTGVRGQVDGVYGAAIDAINAAGMPVLALDLPSGLQCDTGAGQPIVQADVTVTFITRKPGLFTGMGPDHAGDVVFAALGVDDQGRAQAEWSGWVLHDSDRARHLPARRPSTHKGHCGQLLVVGGQQGFGGSTILSAEAAARIGAGKVSLATDAAHIAPALVRCPEVMVRGVRNAHDISGLLAQADVVAIGPGLGQQAWGEGLFDAVLGRKGPCLIDADGLHLLKRMAAGERRDDWILTPHPGEAAMLLDCSAADIQADRLGAARALWQAWGGIVVLKGNGTLVIGGDTPQQLALCPYGNPGMASGGMGDVLGGMIAGLWAQGLSSFDAASMGVLVHAQAADDAAREGGQRGLLASDLADHARRRVNPDSAG